MSKVSKQTPAAIEQHDIAGNIRDITDLGLELVSAELALLRLDIMQQLKAEIILTRRLIIGSALLVVGLCMVLISGALALASILPPWLTALGLGICSVTVGVSILVLAWRRHRSLWQDHTHLRAKISGLVPTPDVVDEFEDDATSFAEEFGLMPDTDANSVVASISDQAELRQHIDKLRTELSQDVSDLRRQSDKYVHAAEGAKQWINKAESFSAKHPSISWLLKLALQEERKK